uniref:Uncharacterized protein n=1 Tax=Ananas comosus var. bracteatus TaxID=296719 RepID=A0A6V7PS19_ANACO|nr:unnamed protein product [Ananas comosus var. bracteatus]
MLKKEHAVLKRKQRRRKQLASSLPRTPSPLPSPVHPPPSSLPCLLLHQGTMSRRRLFSSTGRRNAATSQVCGFHYFTFPSIVGYALPYAWAANSAGPCSNGDVGVDCMVSVVAHELAEMASNPLVNAWYASGDPCFPTKIADLCEGIYGTGSGGAYTGQLLLDQRSGAAYNVNGVGAGGSWSSGSGTPSSTTAPAPTPSTILDEGRGELHQSWGCEGDTAVMVVETHLLLPRPLFSYQQQFLNSSRPDPLLN